MAGELHEKGPQDAANDAGVRAAGWMAINALIHESVNDGRSDTEQLQGLYDMMQVVGKQFAETAATLPGAVTQIAKMTQPDVKTRSLRSGYLKLPSVSKVPVWLLQEPRSHVLPYGPKKYGHIGILAVRQDNAQVVTVNVAPLEFSTAKQQPSAFFHPDYLRDPGPDALFALFMNDVQGTLRRFAR